MFKDTRSVTAAKFLQTVFIIKIVQCVYFHVKIALADEFKLSETYLLSSQTIHRKLPISRKNRPGKYGVQPFLIFVRLVIGKTPPILECYEDS